MKRMICAVLALVLVLSLAACKTPQSGTADPTEAPKPTENSAEVPTQEPTEEPAKPIPYNEDELQKLAAFFDIDHSGSKKNGERLFDNYDPADPATWNGPGNADRPAVVWSEDGHVVNINLWAAESQLVPNDEGGLDPVRLDGELVLDGFPELMSFWTDRVELYDVTIVNCPKLELLILSECVENSVYVSSDSLYRISVSARNTLHCSYKLGEEDTDSKWIELESGYDGAVGIRCCMQSAPKVEISAIPDRDYSFVGWYDGIGKVYSEDETVDITGKEPPVGNNFKLETKFTRTEAMFPMYEGEAPSFSDMCIKVEDGVPVEVDLDFDGKPDTVTVRAEETEHGSQMFMCVVTVTLGSDPDKEYAFATEYAAFDHTMFIVDSNTADERLEVLFTYNTGDDYSAMWALRVNENGDGVSRFGTAADLDFMGDWDDPKSFDTTHGIPVMTRIDLFDTQMVRSHAVVTDEGFRFLEPFRYDEPTEYSHGFRPLKIDMEVTKDGAPMTLPAGTMILPYETDYWTYITLKLEDGTLVRAELRIIGWQYYVNGIDQDEYCDNWYAG
ncbi:MAG: hypothetical protein J5586_01375 [Clostridia bacterium]|nr:hypothetical protein [Clostridia bacterium]